MEVATQLSLLDNFWVKIQWEKLQIRCLTDFVHMCVLIIFSYFGSILTFKGSHGWPIKVLVVEVLEMTNKLSHCWTAEDRGVEVTAIYQRQADSLGQMSSSWNMVREFKMLYGIR